MVSGLIKGATAHFPKIGRFGVWRPALTWAVLIAFALQSYVTQTHIHHLPIPPVASASAVAAQAPTPAEQEEIACPLCQAIAAAGAFIGTTPVAVTFPTIRAQSAALPPITIGLAIPAAGFSWRSRAPPLF